MTKSQEHQRRRRLLRLGLGANEWGLLAAILVVVVVTAVLDQRHNYVNNPADSLYAYVRPTAMLGIFALGSAIVIIAGGIDLSSGSVIAFSATICASIMMGLGSSGLAAQLGLDAGFPLVALAVVGTIVAGIVIGSFHALLITKVGLPPFVATLASLVGLRSAARILSRAVNNASYVPLPGLREALYDWQPAFVPGAVRGLESLFGLAPQKLAFLEELVGIPQLVFVVAAVATAVIMRRTVLGRHLYAMGGNEAAARLSGIRTGRLKWFAYAYSAALASIAGIFYGANEGQASPERMGYGYELNAIAAAVVGGCSLAGGMGTISGVVLGVILLYAVIAGVGYVITSESDLYQGIVVGVVVILAVGFNQLKLRGALWRRRFGWLRFWKRD